FFTAWPAAARELTMQDATTVPAADIELSVGLRVICTREETIVELNFRATVQIVDGDPFKNAVVTLRTHLQVLEVVASWIEIVDIRIIHEQRTARIRARNDRAACAIATYVNAREIGMLRQLDRSPRNVVFLK